MLPLYLGVSPSPLPSQAPQATPPIYYVISLLETIGGCRRGSTGLPRWMALHWYHEEATCFPPLLVDCLSTMHLSYESTT
jgi:hypothetical protein